MSTEIATYDKDWAEQAQRYVEKEKAEGQFISLSGGILKLGDDESEFPGNQMICVILHSIFENTFYGTKYDPDRPSAPTCYAMAENEEDLAPHPSMANARDYFEPQSEYCESCPKNEWGSSDRGKGKACQNRRRLALIRVGFYTRVKGTKSEFEEHIFEEYEHYQTADMNFFKLPVTSGREFSKYVRHLSSEFSRPPYGVVTRIYVEPDAKTQVRVKFECLGVLENEMFPIISARHKEAVDSIITPYSPPDEDDKPSTPRNRLKGLKK